MNQYQKYLNYLIKWLQERVKLANARGVIVGISGGIDSAVVALIAQKAFPKQHLTVFMPCHSQNIDYEYSKMLVEKHQLINKIIDLSQVYDSLLMTLQLDNLKINKLVFANIKPRLRMTSLYALAQEHHYLVLGTDNADEWYTGYFTKHGDGAADLVPLIHLLKKEVYQLAELLHVPKKIINRLPSAGLWENQTDELEMGVSYNELDDYLQGKKISPVSLQKIEELHNISQHKRDFPQKPKKINEI